MKFRLSMMLFLLGFTLVACSNLQNNVRKGGPPKADIKVGNYSFETTLGSYCWEGNGSGKCVDKVGPKELLKGKIPIRVKSGETISLTMKYKPKPRKYSVVQISDNGNKVINVDGNSFKAPLRKGTFFYSFSVWWMDDKKEHVSNGSADYYFVIKVK